MPPKARLPKTIWILGFVSMFMDISSEMVHGVLPVFLTTVMGATYAQVGIIDGVGAGAALLFKVISGPVSDYLKHKKYLVFFGYFVGAISKPCFALATSTNFIFLTHVADRMGKGIRGAPRDALIAEITSPSMRGKAFGLRQSLDTVGAFIGPVLAIMLMSVFGEHLRLLFWLALIPGLMSVALILFGVEEPPQSSARVTRIKVWKFNHFSNAFWEACAMGFILQLCRVGDAFLILRAKDFGITTNYLPGVLIVMNIIYSLTSYPAGALSDKVGRKTVITLGFVILAIANGLLALSSNVIFTLLGVILWGLQMGLTQSNLVALVTDTCDASLRGSALGLFNLFSVIAMVIGGSCTGYLWDHFGASTGFFVASCVAVFGLIILQFQRRLAHLQ